MFIYLIEIEWPEVKHFNNPGEGAGGAVGKKHNLQAAGQQGAVEQILFQESLGRPQRMPLASDLGNRSWNFVALTLHSLLLERSWLLLPCTTSFLQGSWSDQKWSNNTKAITFCMLQTNELALLAVHQKAEQIQCCLTWSIDTVRWIKKRIKVICP